MNLLASVLTSLLPVALVFAQADPSESQPAPVCTFSCPTEDITSLPLLVRDTTIAHDSYYSVIECVYAARNAERTCFYDKHTGAQRLGATEDGCPPRAVPCSASATAPQFSDQDKPETPTWVEGGRTLLWYKEHHRG